MGIYLNPGADNFVLSINDDIYVDKTEIIHYTNDRIGKRRRYLCVSRPRRFGKSMTAEMLCAYYSRNIESKDLFKDYTIARTSDFEKYINKYDVIAINMADIWGRTSNIQEATDLLSKSIIREIILQYPNVDYSNKEDLICVLQEVYLCSKIPFIFIIDEWDCIFRESKDSVESQKQYLDFLRNLLKDKSYVGLAYMTGILPIKKYGTHSALNMFDEFSMTYPREFEKYIGFTEDEVKTLCKKYNRDFNEMKLWYDGYNFSKNAHIYNPKSVVDAVLTGDFRSFWVSTETYEALKLYIDMDMNGLKESIVEMLGGVEQKIDPEAFSNDMTSLRTRDDVLTLLVHLGYLAYDVETSKVSIPNMEIQAEFVRAMKDKKWDKILESINQSERLLTATLEGDCDTVAKSIEQVHENTTSLIAYNDENSLSCVVRLAYYSADKDYVLLRELPTGKGFADIVFIPRKFSDKPAIVIELKWDKKIEGAIAQIKERRYMGVLKEFSGEIIMVGINYDKKSKRHECAIEKARM